MEKVTFIPWSYVDADGEPHIGVTVHGALAKLPPVARARVLRDVQRRE
jgi:hypothetical protein